MAPQQIQSLEILQLPIQELEQKISEVLAENPTLEMMDSGREQLVGNPVESAATQIGAADSAGDDREGGSAEEALAAISSPSGTEFRDDGGGDLDRRDAGMTEALTRLEESYRDYLPESSTGHGHPSAEDEERRQYHFDSLVAPTTLQELLMEQLRHVDGLNERQLEIGEEIIGSIDGTGYLRSHLADIAIAANADLDTVKKMLAVIQQFEPAGIGAQDLRECLLLQLERQGRRDSIEYQAVAKHLEDLGRNQIPRVARALRISPTRLYEVLAEIRRLSPYPGNLSSASLDAATFIVPEVTVSRNADGAWQVEPNRDSQPRLRISPYYLQLLKEPDTGAETKAYIRQKITESKLLLRALDQRQSTIERITWSLLKHQREFFELGREHLHPLTLTQVAQELGLHETTIGRATANKYVRTPQGLFSYKQFFTSGGVVTEEGEKVSNLTVKQKIDELIRAEDPRKPYTDQKLAELLKGQGFNVARRTVAKYREELNIQPTHLRRNFSAAG